MAKRRPKSNEERAAESRAALLGAGAEMLVEGAQRNPFASLRIRALCDRAGYSTGAFYVHWKDTDEYYKELSGYLLAEEGNAWEGDVNRLKAIAQEASPEDPVGSIEQLAAEDIATLVNNKHWDAMELFMITWGRSKEYRTQTAQGYRELDTITANEIYGPLFDRLGREPRDPLEHDQLGAILQSLIEGMGLRHKIDSEVISGTGSDPETPLYPLAVVALIGVLTKGPGDDRDLAAALADLFGAGDRPMTLA